MVDASPSGPGPEPMPADELGVDLPFIRALVDRQFPQYRTARIAIVANGWDNVVARLGDDLAVRVPRRAVAVTLVEHEVRWLPELSPQLPFEVPVPVERGVPDASIPWAWSIVRWVHGEPGDTFVPDAVDGERLARFVRALAVPAPADAPVNPYRAVPLADRASRVESYFERIRLEDESRLRAVWTDALAAEPHGGPAVWVHGDLHPANLVARDGRLVGVIDWGDLSAGDPAGDLHLAWTCLGPAARAAFLGALDVDGATLRRARGNALAHGLACVASSADSPRMAAIGAATLAAVLEDIGP